MSWRRLVAAALLLAVLGAGALWLQVRAWYERPLPGLSADTVVEVAPGERIHQVATRLAREGVLDRPEWWVLLARARGLAARIRAGEFAVPRGTSPAALLQLLVEGKVVLHPAILVEGWTVAEAVEALRGNADLQHTLPEAAGADGRAWLVAAGGPSEPAEGRFFPDTYLMPRRATDADVLHLAYERMNAELAEAWRGRREGLPLASPYEALILASLIEKETAAPEERPQIAAVFMNRLRRGMRLQTDPSVIYGLGDRYDGSLHRRDLVEDTAYNTYTRAGLPPTPIALPGRDSLRAAVQPADSEALFFVASPSGDGHHIFSETLAAHEAAVRRYVQHARTLGRPTGPP
jgi:UPF0755 protein